MSLNPVLGKDKTTKDVFPLPLPNEYFILSRTGVSLSLSKNIGAKELKGDGFIFLTNIRLVFVRDKDPATSKDFNSMEFPLHLIRHRNDTFCTPEFQQPIFGCNRMIGKIYPDTRAQYPLLDLSDWTIYFKRGGCEAFCRAFDYAIRHVQYLPADGHVTPFSISPNQIAAFYDPSDPSRVYVAQPVFNTENCCTNYQPS